MPQKTIKEIVHFLKSQGIEFRVANQGRTLDGKFENLTTFHIMTVEKYHLSNERDGGKAKTNFRLDDATGQLRHAVICRVEIKKNSMVFYPSPNPITRAITSKICLLLNGTMGEDINPASYCWEENIPFSRRQF